MAKIKIKSYLKNVTKNEENLCETSGILIKNKIIFYDNELKVTLDITDSNVVMHRYTDNANYIYILFDKTNPVCKCYTNNKHVDLDIKINSLTIKDNLIEVNYIIEDTDELLFLLNYGE